MYLHPIWSLLLLASVAGLYFGIIRPRLQSKFLDLYADIDNFWERWLARLIAFRSYAATILAAVLIAGPDIAVQLAPVDLSGVIGEKWAKLIAALLTVFLVLNSVLKTKPGETK